MIRPWRPLALAAVLCATASVGVATAQTVILKNAQPGAVVEVLLNGTRVGSATGDSAGIVRVAVNALTEKNLTETVVQIYAEACGTTQRVGLVERGLQGPPLETGCDRRDVGGFYVLRPVTTIVLDVTTSSPTILTRQGPAPPAWLMSGPVPPAAFGPIPPALALFGGGSLVSFRDATPLSCGGVAPCTGKDFRPAYTVGVAYWGTRFLGAEVSFVKSAKVTVEGAGSTFRFKSVLDADVLAIAGNIGGSAGPVRLYGQAGFNYHEATSTTTQTVDDTLVTIDGVAQTIKGGTQTLAYRTGGWGWLAGAGIEIWLTRPLGIYGDAGFAKLKGTDLDGGEAAIDDRIAFVRFGARIRIGR